MMDFERGRFWRRALALLIDLAVAAVILQLIALIAFPITGGRAQFVSGLAPNCSAVNAIPKGLSLPADYAVGWITDCRYDIFGMTSARILTVTRIPQNEATASARTNIVHLLDAEGTPFNAPTLDSLALPFLFVLRFWFDRGRGTLGRRICGVRLTAVIEAPSPLPIGAATGPVAGSAANKLSCHFADCDMAGGRGVARGNTLQAQWAVILGRRGKSRGCACRASACL
jgi:hypothetical protein